MEKLQVRGLEILNDSEHQDFNRLLEKYYEKIKRSIRNDFYIKISIKNYSKIQENKEKRKRFGIEVEISGEIPRVHASDVDWNLNKALNKVFNKILIEIEHKFHISDKY